MSVRKLATGVLLAAAVIVATSACSVTRDAVASTPIVAGSTIAEQVAIGERFIATERLNWLRARAHEKFADAPQEQLATLYVQYTVFKSTVDSRNDRVELQVKLREGPRPAGEVVEYCRDLIAHELEHAPAPSSETPRVQ
jgi:hypothetical protein